VIEDAARTRAAVRDRLPHERGELRVVHRRVGAECDEIVERRDARAELALERREHHRHRHRPRAVGDDDEHAPTIDRQRAKALAGNCIQLLAAEIALGHPFPDSLHSLNIVMQLAPDVLQRLFP